MNATQTAPYVPSHGQLRAIAHLYRARGVNALGTLRIVHFHPTAEGCTAARMMHAELCEMGCAVSRLFEEEGQATYFRITTSD